MTKRLYRLMPSLLAALAISSGCIGPLKGLGGKGTPPPAVVVNEAVTEALLRPPEVTEFKGYGEINMSGGGAKASGKIEAHRKNNGYLKAQIYSPFGTSVASMSSEDFRGVVRVDKEAIEFSYSDKMENVPFPCAKNFTYGQFIKSLTGAMPDAFRELPATPDSLKQSKKAPGKATAVWNSDTLSVRALIVGKKGKDPRLETVTFRYNVDGAKFSIQFTGFKKGIASEITLKEGSKNYIMVKYESVVGR